MASLCPVFFVYPGKGMTDVLSTLPNYENILTITNEKILINSISKTANGIKPSTRLKITNRALSHSSDFVARINREFRNSALYSVSIVNNIISKPDRITILLIVLKG